MSKASYQQLFNKYVIQVGTLDDYYEMIISWDLISFHLLWSDFIWLLEELKKMGGNDANIMMRTQRVPRSRLYDTRKRQQVVNPYNKNLVGIATIEMLRPTCPSPRSLPPFSERDEIQGIACFCYFWCIRCWSIEEDCKMENQHVQSVSNWLVQQHTNVHGKLRLVPGADLHS